ncbi:MAG TPA: hypothetical protein VGE98_00075, partial [Thermoanaerobaculia bacterium]
PEGRSGAALRPMRAPGRRRGPRRRLPHLALFAALVLLPAGCATRGPSPIRTSREPVAPLWELPPGDLGSQRLYRATYAGPEGDGGFRITLRLVSAARYQVETVDPLGRALWSLDVAAGGGRFVDHRGHTTCAFTGALDLSGLALGPFPLVSLPALLLDRLPAAPSGPVATSGHEIRFKDAAGRSFRALVDEDGALASWTLDDGGGGVWWTHSDGWSILSARGRRAQVRFREVLAEKLPREPPPLVPPADYRETQCGPPI